MKSLLAAIQIVYINKDNIYFCVGDKFILFNTHVHVYTIEKLNNPNSMWLSTSGIMLAHPHPFSVLEYATLV